MHMDSGESSITSHRGCAQAWQTRCATSKTRQSSETWGKLKPASADGYAMIHALDCHSLRVRAFPKKCIDRHAYGRNHRLSKNGKGGKEIEKGKRERHQRSYTAILSRLTDNRNHHPQLSSFNRFRCRSSSTHVLSLRIALGLFDLAQMF
jgi:hypothetical protein